MVCNEEKREDGKEEMMRSWPALQERQTKEFWTRTMSLTYVCNHTDVADALQQGKEQDAMKEQLLTGEERRSAITLHQRTLSLGRSFPSCFSAAAAVVAAAATSEQAVSDVENARLPGAATTADEAAGKRALLLVESAAKLLEAGAFGRRWAAEDNRTKEVRILFAKRAPSPVSISDWRLVSVGHGPIVRGRTSAFDSASLRGYVGPDFTISRFYNNADKALCRLEDWTLFSR